MYIYLPKREKEGVLNNRTIKTLFKCGQRNLRLMIVRYNEVDFDLGGVDIAADEEELIGVALTGATTNG